MFADIYLFGILQHFGVANWNLWDFYGLVLDEFWLSIGCLCGLSESVDRGG